MDLRIPDTAVPKGRFATAFSGGGDSTALVYALCARNPLVLIVDHGLRANSGEDAEAAAAFAKGLGLETRILRWDAGRIDAAVQEKARAARYALLGEACRAAGITDLLTGHTEDDQAETVLMRLDRHTGWRGAAGMAAVNTAPIWPALAGLTLWRPLLSMSRAQLRDYVRAHALPFIEDPSNENRDFTRIQTRDRLRLNPRLRADMLSLSADARQGLLVEREHLRGIAAQRVTENNGAIDIKGPVPRQLLRLCLLAVSGQGGPIERTKLARLSRLLSDDDDHVVTLAGCQIIKTGRHTQIIRNPGAAKPRRDRPAIAPLTLSSTPQLWDGRWWIKSALPGLSVAAYGTVSQHCDADMKAAFIRNIDAPLRPTWPVILRNGAVSGWAGAGETPDFHIQSAVMPRLTKMLCGKLP